MILLINDFPIRSIRTGLTCVLDRVLNRCLELKMNLFKPKHYTQYHLIRTTVNFLLVMVLIFSQNFTSNGPYVVLNFCEFSDTMVVIF